MNVSGVATGAAWSYSTDGGATFTTGAGTSFALTGDGVKNVLVNQSWGPGDVSPNASLTFTLDADILWQNTSGQAAIWEMNGTNLIGGGAPQPQSRTELERRLEPAISTATAFPTFCGRTPTGKPSIWEMNGTTLTGSARRAPIQDRTGRRSEPATSTATAIPTFCCRTRTANVAIWDMNGTTLMAALS